MGYSDTETVKLDWDDTAFDVVNYWASKTNNRFKLLGYIILKSSENSYHTVFNRKISSWEKNKHIMRWVALESDNKSSMRYVLQQENKGFSSLRVGPKFGKSGPRIVYCHGEQDGEIRNFMLWRKEIKNMLRKIEKEYELFDSLASIAY